MPEKDLWDKTEVIIKLVGSVVLVAIPIMISIGANRISQSMERGKLVESLLAELTNEEKRMRRDLALIALDAAVPPPEKCGFLGWFNCGIDETASDMVSDVALVLWRELGRSGETAEAAKIITKRKPTTHKTLLIADALVTSDPDPDFTVNEQTSSQIAQKARIVSRLVAQSATSKSPAPVQPDSALAGVRTVYIQYRDDIGLAERIRAALREKGVSVPRLEQVSAIRQDDIRYRNADEMAAAKRLRDFLRTGYQIQIGDNKLIDLSRRGYEVPVGQFEVWIDA
jgi:hypothetical protein